MSVFIIFEFEFSIKYKDSYLNKNDCQFFFWWISNWAHPIRTSFSWPARGLSGFVCRDNISTKNGKTLNWKPANMPYVFSTKVSFLFFHLQYDTSTHGKTYPVFYIRRRVHPSFKNLLTVHWFDDDAMFENINFPIFFFMKVIIIDLVMRYLCARRESRYPIPYSWSIFHG